MEEGQSLGPYPTGEKSDGAAEDLSLKSCKRDPHEAGRLEELRS